jgi:hypothetical protein
LFSQPVKAQVFGDFGHPAAKLFGCSQRVDFDISLHHRFLAQIL